MVHGRPIFNFLFFSFLLFNAELLTQQTMATFVLRWKTLSKFLIVNQ